MDAFEEAYQTYRDVLRQIAVHDPSPAMADAAGVLLDGPSQAALGVLVAGAFDSPYGRRLLDALAAMALFKPEAA